MCSIQDVLATTDALDDNQHRELKRVLKRIVSMLTRLIARADTVSESNTDYNVADEYEYRDAEYEYEYETEDEPEPSRAPEPGLRPFSNGQSNFPVR